MIPTARVDEVPTDSPSTGPIEPAHAPTRSTTSQRRLAGIASAVVIAAPAVVHLRYGLGDVGHLEEWTLFTYFDAFGPQFWARPGTMRESSMVRPLELLPGSLAWLIERNSFAAWHVLVAAGLTLRSWGMWLLARQLGCAHHVAAATSLLFALYPAWQGALTTRTLHFQFASAAVTWAAWLLIRSARQVRVGELTSMAVLTGTGLLIYEAYYAVVAVVPLLLVAAGLRGRRLWALTGAWYVVPAVNLARVAWVWRYGPTQYQEALAANGNIRPGDLVRLAGRVWVGSFERVVRPWYGWSVGPFAALLTIVACASLVVPVVQRGRLGVDDPSPRRAHLIAVAAAFVFLPAAALVYSPYPVHLSDPLRIFYVVAFPGSLMIGWAIVSLRKTAVQLGACVLLVGAVLSGAVTQRRHWHEVSAYQERILGAVATEYARHGAPADIVVLDPARRTGGIYTVHPGFFTIDLRYLFGDHDLTVTLCHVAAGERFELPVGASCRLHGGRVTLEDGRTVSDAEVLTVELSPSGVAYVSGASEVGRPVPARVTSTLACVADRSCEPFGPNVDFGAPGLE